jgi:DNA replicative helicase MCM subunit Mcm2 (Cdc46/Mcm family)
MGVSLSIVARNKYPYSSTPLVIYPRIYNLPATYKTTSFADIKSGKVGNLTAIEGHVIKVSNVKPYIHKCVFACLKCGFGQWVTLEDG